jgi:hypothetical protein
VTNTASSPVRVPAHGGGQEGAALALAARLWESCGEIESWQADCRCERGPSLTLPVRGDAHGEGTL